MTHAICVRCGAMKFGCLLPCKSCGELPRTRRQIAYSYLFSDHCHDVETLRGWSEDAVLRGIALPGVGAAKEEALVAAYAKGIALPLMREDAPDMLDPLDAPPPDTSPDGAPPS